VTIRMEPLLFDRRFTVTITHRHRKDDSLDAEVTEQ
jgi:hypothetical protein